MKFIRRMTIQLIRRPIAEFYRYLLNKKTKPKFIKSICSLQKSIVKIDLIKLDINYSKKTIYLTIILFI